MSKWHNAENMPGPRAWVSVNLGNRSSCRYCGCCYCKDNSHYKYLCPLLFWSSFQGRHTSPSGWWGLPAPSTTPAQMRSPLSSLPFLQAGGPDCISWGWWDQKEPRSAEAGEANRWLRSEMVEWSWVSTSRAPPSLCFLPQVTGLHGQALLSLLNWAVTEAPACACSRCSTEEEKLNFT